MKLRWIIAVCGALALGLVGCLVLLLTQARTGEATDLPARAAAFQEVFGFPAPADANVVSTWYRSGDLSIRWIRVTCDPETIVRLRILPKAHPERFQAFQPPPGTPRRREGGLPRLYLSNTDALPRWWTDATDLPRDAEQFKLGWKTPKGQDLVFVWINSTAGVVYAARNANQY